MIIEDSNQEIINQEVTRVTQKTRSKTRSTPLKQTQNRSTAPAASDVDVDILKLKTTTELVSFSTPVTMYPTPLKQTRQNRSTAPCADLPDPRASARLDSALDSSAIPSLSSSSSSVSASFRTIRKEEALVACSTMWAQQGLKCAPAPSDVDVDLFKLN